MSKSSLTYKDAGVDTEKAADLVKDIAAMRAKTEVKRQLFQSFGLFAAGFDLSDYRNPVIMTGCDGVGTKIELLQHYDLIEAAGVDLVAMNVNDVLTTHALPIMFLDYIGIPKLDEDLIRRLVAGMTDALAGCDCVLAGGETAEMPGIVPEGAVELSGFCVGVAEKEDLADPSSIEPGDAIIGIPSDGIHANGWSLVRRLLQEFPDTFSRDELVALLAPTRIYYPEVRAVQEAGVVVKGMAHITGGGIPENLVRILGSGGAKLELPAWDNAPARKLIDLVSEDTALHTFNLGIGYMMVCAPDQVDALRAAVPHGTVIGEVTAEAGLSVEVPA